MLMSKETSEALDILYGEFFNCNSLLDNCQSIMQNVWTMPQASDILHHQYAHPVTQLADFISAIKDNYNLRSIRTEVPRHAEDYDDLLDMMEHVLEEFTNIYKMINLTIQVAHEHGDYNAYSDLLDFLTLYNKIYGNVVTLRDKAQQLPKDYVRYDRYITSWHVDNTTELIGNFSL